jgi:hypothetical protein
VKRVDIEKVTRVYDDFFRIDEAHLRYERFDGSTSPTVRRLKFERGDSVAVLLYKPKPTRILLVNQFKYPTYNNGPEGGVSQQKMGTSPVLN